MEMFYIFGFGVLSTLLVLGIIYSVGTIFKIKKEVDTTITEMEDFKRDFENKIDELHARLDTEIDNFAKIINQLK